MREIDQALLLEYDKKTKRGYPLGEIKQDLLERGYTEEEAEAFLSNLGKKFIDQTAKKEAKLIQTAALILFTCGIVMHLGGFHKGKWFMISASIWWLTDYFSKELKKDKKADTEIE